MVSLAAAIKHLNGFLEIDKISDYPQAHNGLQLENSGSIKSIAAAVDACEPVVRAAALKGADFLLVHHGLYWNNMPLVGGIYRKMRCAIEHDLAIYSAHLPLDVHPLVGNNVLLAKAIGLNRTIPFLHVKSQPAGLVGSCRMGRDELLERLEGALGGPIHVCAAGPAKVRRVGIITGAAGAEVARVAAEGVDTFITGEGPHWSYTLAEELGVNLVYGGHYATETFGVKALAEHLSARFQLPWFFIDHPTGL